MAGALRLCLLGDLQVTLDGQPLVDFTYSRTLAILCYLAAVGRPQTRDRLVGLLWDGVPEANARKNLRNVLSDLRRVLPDHVMVDGGNVTFNRAAPYFLDIEAFSRPGRPPAAGLTPAQAAAWGEALDYY